MPENLYDGWESLLSPAWPLAEMQRLPDKQLVHAILVLQVANEVKSRAALLLHDRHLQLALMERQAGTDDLLHPFDDPELRWISELSLLALGRIDKSDAYMAASSEMREMYLVAARIVYGQGELRTLRQDLSRAVAAQSAEIQHGAPVADPGTTSVAESPAPLAAAHSQPLFGALSASNASMPAAELGCSPVDQSRSDFANSSDDSALCGSSSPAETYGGLSRKRKRQDLKQAGFPGGLFATTVQVSAPVASTSQEPIDETLPIEETGAGGGSGGTQTPNIVSAFSATTAHRSAARPPPTNASSHLTQDRTNLKAERRAASRPPGPSDALRPATSGPSTTIPPRHAPRTGSARSRFFSTTMLGVRASNEGISKRRGRASPPPSYITDRRVVQPLGLEDSERKAFTGHTSATVDAQSPRDVKGAPRPAMPRPPMSTGARGPPPPPAPLTMATEYTAIISNLPERPAAPDYAELLGRFDIFPGLIRLHQPRGATYAFAVYSRPEFLDWAIEQWNGQTIWGGLRLKVDYARRKAC